MPSSSPPKTAFCCFTEVEAELLRALADPDPTVQRIAAIHARKRSSPRVLAALEPLLAHEDKYLRRAAAASYVAMHPRGPAAPALRPLHDDPADLVKLTARGALLDRGHEMAELAFVVRTLAYAGGLDASTFATTITRWHRFLWRYSPTPRARVALDLGALDRDAASLRDAIAASACHDATLLQFELRADALGIRGFVHGRATWHATTAVQLPALRRLVELARDVGEAPWNTIFADGAFALAVAPAIDPAKWLGTAREREIATRIDEPLFLGFLRATGITFTDDV